MMRFFVRNLFAKLFLLGLLAVPLALYGLGEGKRLAEAGIADDRKLPPASGGETELKLLQEESAKRAAMPSDLRKELVFPDGRPANDAGEPFADLSKAVRNRALILAAHRTFLLQYNAAATGTEPALKFDPLFAASLGKDLTARYARLWSDRRDQLVSKARLADLRNQLAKADAKTLPDLAKEINQAIEEYNKRWPANNDIVSLRDSLARRQLEFAFEAAERDCITLDAAWKRLVQLPSPAAIKSTQPPIDELLQRLKTLTAELQTRDDSESRDRLKWAAGMTALWTKRRDFLPELLTLLERMDKALADARVDDFFAGCKSLIDKHPTIDETKGMVRGIAEDFCTRYLVKPPKEPLKYDDVVLIFGEDRQLYSVPRRQVKIYYKKVPNKEEERRFLEDGDPVKNDGYTEFHAERDKDKIEKITVYDAGRTDPLNNVLIQRKIEHLRPTPKSAAVRFYCDEYRKVDRWTAAAVSDFLKKCEAHKENLGEIYDRLSRIDAALKRAKALFESKT